MKLTENDKNYLRSLGNDDEDIQQIEEATQKRYTQYTLNGAPLSRESAIQLLGKEKYLSGIARSAFHVTARRVTDNGEDIMFDSKKLFE